MNLKSVMLCGVIAAAALLTGCSTTKTRSIDLAGMYASESGQLAIGAVKVQAIEQGTVAAIINYEEDNAWLAPSMKLHNIGITLTGTNSVEKADKIVRHICEAFVSVAPSLKGEAPATTLYSEQTKRAEIKQAAKALKSAAAAQPEGAATTAATTKAMPVEMPMVDPTACPTCTDTPSSVE